MILPRARLIRVYYDAFAADIRYMTQRRVVIPCR